MGRLAQRLGLTGNSHGAPPMNTKSEPKPSSLRITKKLSPESRGALKLARQFGDTLVCVRHRMDAKGEFRYTTVELLVEKTAVSPRTDKIVAVRIGPDEKALQTAVRAAGATWDYNARVWRMPRRVAGILRLADRITEK